MANQSRTVSQANKAKTLRIVDEFDFSTRDAADRYAEENKGEYIARVFQYKTGSSKKPVTRYMVRFYSK